MKKFIGILFGIGCTLSIMFIEDKQLNVFATTSCFMLSFMFLGSDDDDKDAIEYRKKNEAV